MNIVHVVQGNKMQTLKLSQQHLDLIWYFIVICYPVAAI